MFSLWTYVADDFEFSLTSAVLFPSRKWKEIVDEWVMLKAPGEPATVIGNYHFLWEKLKIWELK